MQAAGLKAEELRMANTDLIPASLLARKAVVCLRQSQPEVMSNLES